MKLLLLDIETAPNLAYVWGIFKENIPIQRLVSSGYVLCWAAKWYGTDEVMFDSIHKSSPKKMLKRIHRLLNEADAVIHYNGKSFDIPTLNKEFVSHEMEPPAPYKQIDLLQVCRAEFRFASNKLDYVAKQLGLGTKVGHEGFELWTKCMAGDPDAWVEMEKYNAHDVVLLEQLYERIRPWIKTHPNHGLYSDDAQLCPNCGSSHFIRRGYAYTNAGKYPRFRCVDCGHWFRGAYVKKELSAQKFRSVAS